MKKVLFAWLSIGIHLHLLCDCPPALDPLPSLPIPAAVPPPVAACETPTPDTIEDYLPITFVNDTGTNADDVYIAVLVNSSTQYLSFTEQDGHFLATISDFTPKTYLSNESYSYPLSSFEEIEDDTYTFYIPNTGNNAQPGSNFMTSSRILLSVSEPLTYFIDNNGVLQVPADSIATDDNYYILNDKIEFDIGSNGFNRLNLNLTWVDFFGLPLLVQVNYRFLFGGNYTNACGVTGMPSGVSFSDVFEGYTSALASLKPTFETHWGGLVATYTNPAGAGGEEAPLRIFAPATAMGSTQTQSNPTPVTFPTNYFLRSITSSEECSWFNAVWKGTTQSGATAFYEQKKPVPYLVLNATTDAGAATAQGKEAEDGSFLFTIQGGPDKGKTITFPLPTSSKAFFTGAVSDYEPPIVSTASAATNAQVLKVFASAIIAGFFPINCQFPTPITLNNTYARNHASEYFQNNPLLQNALEGCSCVANVPWYDFYSRTLLTIGTPNLFYTSAYSDFLGADGTIVVVNLNTENADASITVHLNSLEGAVIPNPYGDTTEYSLTVGIPSDATVEYATSSDGPFSGTIPDTAQADEIFLRVTYNAGTYNGESYITQVAPSVGVFHPVLPGEGAITSSGTDVTINIGASPK